MIRAIVTVLLIQIAFYLLWASVQADLRWASGVMSWGPLDRALFAYWLLVVPLVYGSLTYLWFGKKESNNAN